MKPFFTTEWIAERIHASCDDFYAEIAEVCSAKVAPLVEENERLRTIEKLMETDPEWGNEFAAVTHFKAESERLTAQLNDALSVINKCAAMGSPGAQAFLERWKK